MIYGFRFYDDTEIYRLIALYTTNAYSAEREMSASACTRSMADYVVKTASSCFAVLRQIRSIRRSVSRPTLQTLVASLVLSKLDYGCATSAALPAILLDSLRSVLNAAARLIYGRGKYDHVTPLLRELH